MARSQLWSEYSTKQIYLTCLEAHSPENGPALTFTSLIPITIITKAHSPAEHIRSGSTAQQRRRTSSLRFLPSCKGLRQPVKAEDIMAYLAAVMAHPAFTARFRADLVRPGLRVPLTADAKLFVEAVALGSEVIWLHCYGERFVDPKANRPKQAPRLPKESAPNIRRAAQFRQP